MISVLIDTSILNTLVNPLETDRNLLLLSQWAEEKEIQVLAPHEIKQEWNDKHRKKRLKEATEAIRKNKKEHKLKLFNGVNDAEADIDNHLKRVNDQVAKIDRLLNASPEIFLDGEVLTHIENLRRRKEPPFFHSKSDKANDNDAKIIFFTLQHLKGHGIKELVFISGNDNEFESKDRPGNIHAIIREYAPDITIHYFNKCNDATAFLISKGLKGKQEYRVKAKVDNNITVDREKHSSVNERFLRALA